MASTIPYLSTALCPVFVANPHAGSEATDALVEPLHAHVYLSRLQLINISLAFEFSMLRTADTIEVLVFDTHNSLVWAVLRRTQYRTQHGNSMECMSGRRQLRSVQLRKKSVL